MLRSGLTAAAIAIAAGLVSTSGTHAAGAAAPAADPYAPALTAATFADPPAVVREKYRWWWPGAYLDDQEIQDELHDVAAHGGGGVEVAYFTPPGGGSNPNLRTYGWGEKEFAKKLNVALQAAKANGLELDSTIGARWPTMVPSLSNFNQPAAQKKLIFGSEFVSPGATRSGPLTATTDSAPPTVTTALCTPVAPGDGEIAVANVNNLRAGDQISMGTETFTIADIGAKRNCTTLAAAASAGATNIRVAAVTNFIVGEQVKIGDETVMVTGPSDANGAFTGTAGATGTGVNLGAPLAAGHASGEFVQDPGSGVKISPPATQARTAGTTVTDTALTHLIAVVAAQCAAACASADPPPRMLDPASVVDLTSRLDASGNLSWTAPQGNGNPWVLLNFSYTADGQNFTNLTTTTPNYIVDHLSKAGAQIVIDDWDNRVLSFPGTQSLIDQIGGVSLFEDSLELSNNMKWTPDLADEWQSRLGYPLYKALPALAGALREACPTVPNPYPGARCSTPAFDLAGGVGPRAREDYQKMWNALYVDNRLDTLRDWLHGRNMRLRVQAYGEPIDMASAPTHSDIPEGESLAFTNNPEYFKVVAIAAHMAGTSVVSSECCAIFTRPYGSTATQYVPYVMRAAAGGVTSTAWHGYSYKDAPNQSWPGWNSFGTGVTEQFARGPQWDDWTNVNLQLARLNLVLRQGKPRFDVGVYWQDYGVNSTQNGLQGVPTSGGNLGYGTLHTFNAGTQDADDRPMGSATVAVKTALNDNGFTYEYVSPDFVTDPTIASYRPGATPNDGAVFPERSAYKAFVLFNQDTIRPEAYARIVDWAEHGMPLVIIGALPTRAQGGSDAAARDAQVLSLSDRLRALVDDGNPAHHVTKVDSEAQVPAKLAAFGVRPSAGHAPVRAIDPVRRHTDDADYYYLFNQTADTISQTVTLEGSGVPFALDALTGKISRIANYTAGDGTVTMPVSIASNHAIVIAVSAADLDGGPAPRVHAVSSTADETVFRGDDIAVRATRAGTYTTQLSDGRTATTSVSDVPAARFLDSWSLSVDQWSAGSNTPRAQTPNSAHWSTAVAPLGSRPVSADANHVLPAWQALTDAPSLAGKSGRGTYTATVDLPPGWTGGHGAYLDLGQADDTATVTVNGHDAGPIDQVDRGRRVDVGPYLVSGANTIVVRVSTNLFNATGGAPQNYGLIGPVRLIPYGEATAFSTTDATGTVGGSVPATLSLSLGPAASFGAFTAGVAKDYTAQTTANVTSTAGDAALSVSDPGHLTNGAFSLPQPLQVTLSKASWTGPVSNDVVSIAFAQHIDANDALRTGTYSRTLTFTLSTTTP